MQTRITKLALLGITALFLTDAFANSSELCLINKTNQVKNISITDIDSYDWTTQNQPGNNFNNLAIKPGEILCQKEDTNNYGIAHFTIIIDNQKINLQSATGGGITGSYTFWCARSNGVFSENGLHDDQCYAGSKSAMILHRQIVISSLFEIIK